MNNFDYFSEIEGAFVRRRGKNLLLSPVDWALIESWEKQGVPLNIVLATIDEIFDQVDADPKRTGSVRTLSYCKDAVEARFRSWREGKIGSSDIGSANGESGSEREAETGAQISRLLQLAGSLESTASSSSPELKTALDSAAAELRELDSAEDAAAVESRLEAMDTEIDDALFASLADDEMYRLLEGAEMKIGPRGASMDDEEFVRTRNLVAKKSLRESSGIPPLSRYRL